MRKISARHTWLVLPAILALLMTFIVSGVSTLRAVGLPPDFFSKWMQAWGLSYVIALPVTIVVLPLVRRIVAAITEAPAGN